MQPSPVSIQAAEPRPAGEAPALKLSTKVALIVLLLGILWLRLMLRRRSKDRVCSHCGLRNPPHRRHCTKCSAPLFGE